MTLEQIADDFGIHPMTLGKWLRQAAIDAGEKSGVTSAEAKENREVRRRVKLLEQENECCGERPRISVRRICPKK